jgi:hypothetical protein
MLGEYVAERRTIDDRGRFHRAEAQWPSDVATPGLHHVTAILYDRAGQELGRVAPRLVSVGMRPGY